MAPRPPRSCAKQGTQSLRSLQQTREYLRHNGGDRVTVEVHAADGIRSAKLMWVALTHHRHDHPRWEVKHLRQLGAAAALDEPTADARSAVRSLIAKLSGHLLVVFYKGGKPMGYGSGGAQGGALSISGVQRFKRSRGRGAHAHAHGGVHAQGGGVDGALDGSPRARPSRGRGRRRAHGGGGHAAPGGEHDDRGSVSFADRSGWASAKGFVDDMREAEKTIRATSSTHLLPRAKDLADRMKAARLALRKFGEDFSSLESMSGCRWKGEADKRFDKLDSRRREHLTLVKDLLRHLDQFAAATISFE
jgi:hypothetical protein